MNEIDRKKYLEDIKNNLTIDQIYEFLADAGGEPQIHGDIIKTIYFLGQCFTICF